VPQSGLQPSQGTRQSTSGTQQSTSGSQQSMNGTQQSTSGSQQTSNGTQQSTNGTQQSTSGTQQSTAGTQQSTAGTQQSTNGTQTRPTYTTNNGTSTGTNRTTAGSNVNSPDLFVTPSGSTASDPFGGHTYNDSYEQSVNQTNRSSGTQNSSGQTSSSGGDQSFSDGQSSSGNQSSSGTQNSSGSGSQSSGNSTTGSTADDSDIFDDTSSDLFSDTVADPFSDSGSDDPFADDLGSGAGVWDFSEDDIKPITSEGTKEVVYSDPEAAAEEQSLYAALLEGTGWSQSAGSSLRAAYTAVQILDWANRTGAGNEKSSALKKTVREEYGRLSDEEKANFKANWSFISYDVETMLDDFSSLQGTFDDAGCLAEAQAAVSDRNVLRNWKAVHDALEAAM